MSTLSEGPSPLGCLANKSSSPESISTSLTNTFRIQENTEYKRSSTFCAIYLCKQMLCTELTQFVNGVPGDIRKL